MPSRLGEPCRRPIRWILLPAALLALLGVDKIEKSDPEEDDEPPDDGTPLEPPPRRLQMIRLTDVPLIVKSMMDNLDLARVGKELGQLAVYRKTGRLV